MAVPTIQNAFTAGELSPSLFGRTDLARAHVGASTMRNMFCSYRGGAYSRAGTAFVGFSKQTGRAFPPRLIPFQFSINQGLALEFGNFYMRVIINSAYVTEIQNTITGVTQGPGAAVSFDATEGAASATANNAGVISSYAPGDLVALAGGTYSEQAVLSVTNTKLIKLAVDVPGITYVPADTIHLTGGVQSTAAVVTVTSTQVSAATVHTAGTNTHGQTSTTVEGTTGTGVRFTALVAIDTGGAGITSVTSITIPGNYTVNPTTLSNEPVTDIGSGGLTGAALSLSMGVGQISITTPGVFTTNPVGGTFTQASSSGSGTGATFQLALFAPNVVGVSSVGIYTTFPSNPVAQASTTGAGIGVTFTVTTGAAAPYLNDGDWAYIAGVNGMTQVNGRIYVVQSATATSAALFDVYGNPIDTSAFGAYTSGGTISRIYTVATPYAEADLKWLKFTQSADTMSICCVNQMSQTEYEPQDLSRLADDNWIFTPAVPAPTITPPASLSGVTSTAGSVDYNYAVTSINPADGTESISSPIADIPSAVDIASTAGSNTLTWSVVNGVNLYNIYKATPAYAGTVPVGAQFGYAGSAYGTQFVDSNIVADFAQVPPTHQNPFARGQIISADITAGGSGSSFAITINSAAGSGAVLVPVVVSNVLVAIIVEAAGENYLPTDTLSITNGAAAKLVVGPQSGTYPSVPAYYQERRGYANSLNNPDTYWFSQPGAFTNFDTRDPTIDSDAITGSPWSVEVNGIQFMVLTAGGLLVFTGLANWLLVGVGSFATNVQAFTPSSQVANPQPENGCSPTIPPIKINYDVIYVSSKGSFYWDQPYQLYALSEPVDITETSSHLFTGYTILEHAWCQQPYKLIWAVRNDGVLLSLTWLKQQQVAGWARHDTNGLFKSVCSVTEPPVDALYLAVERFIGGNTAYMVERMDNRIWATVEDTWCVDCGLSLSQPTPAATLTASSATGRGSLTGVTGLIGGNNYSSFTTATVVDDEGDGPGTGAVPTLTIVGGVITAITFAGGQQGLNYVYPDIVILDPTNAGSGASAQPILNNSATFSASAGVFNSGSVGSVIRMGGGIAAITAYTNTQTVTANITSPIIETINDGVTPVPLPQTSGNWTLTAPVSTISGLGYLAGATVTGIADGQVIAPTVVPSSGIITLATPASSVLIGLGFQAQLQSMYLDAGEPTVQGQRKKVAAVTARIELSLGMEIGGNQPDGSTLSPPQIAPSWTNLKPLPDKGIAPYGSKIIPLFTGDTRIPVTAGIGTPGQVCLEQNKPLPMQILSLINEVLEGDSPSTQAPQKQQRGSR